MTSEFKMKTSRGLWSQCWWPGRKWGFSEEGQMILTGAQCVEDKLSIYVKTLLNKLIFHLINSVLGMYSKTESAKHPGTYIFPSTGILHRSDDKSTIATYLNMDQSWTCYFEKKQVMEYYKQWFFFSFLLICLNQTQKQTKPNNRNSWMQNYKWKIIKNNIENGNQILGEGKVLKE